MSQKPQKYSILPYVFLGTSLFFAFIAFFSYYKNTQIPKITEKQFESILKSGNVKEVVLAQSGQEVRVILKKKKPKFFLSSIFGQQADFIWRVPNSIVFDSHYKDIQRKIPPKLRKEYSLEESSGLFSLLGNPLTLLLILLLLLILMNFLGAAAGLGGAAGGILGIGKARAKFWNKESDVKIGFGDVQGMREAKQELQEVVDYFKNPEKFLKLGARPPKGALLVGPPGTGKTLLARAVAGEANINFLSTEGSAFSDMFVGVGGNRVRDLFNTAEQNAPCIVFIDEIDAVGRKRSRGGRHGNEEAANTLNQLLTRMDGFTPQTNIFVIGATNIVEVLDKALLRSGRFDRQIPTSKPVRQERIETFDYYCKRLPKLDKDIDTVSLADQTAGFSYADIDNVCNEAAFIAARKGKKKIDMEDFQDAIDRQIGGIPKPSRIVSPEEKYRVAIHEAGHGLVSLFIEYVAPLVKITTIPRGTAALGFAQYQPQEKFIYEKEQLLGELIVLLGGRAAEDLVLGSRSTGASDDLQRATKMALGIAAKYGMSDVIGHSSFSMDDDPYQLEKPYSQATAQLIDQEVKRMLDEAYDKAKSILGSRIDMVKKVADALIQKEVLFAEDIRKIIGMPSSEKKENKTSKKEKEEKESI